jgi:hypothetical protein
MNVGVNMSEWNLIFTTWIIAKHKVELFAFAPVYIQYRYFKHLRYKYILTVREYYSDKKSLQIKEQVLKFLS